MLEWDLFLKNLEKTMPGSPVQNWTTYCQVLKFDAQNLFLKINDIFAFQFFKEHIEPYLKNFKNANSHPIKVHLELSFKDSTLEKKEQKITSPFVFDDSSPFYLEDFIETESSAFVLSVLKTLNEPNNSFNPLFIYGAKSSGKTHLLMGAFHFFKKKGLKCLYVSCDTFTEQVVYAMRHSMMAEFRSIYRGVDMLFVDNVQILANKVATQEEFFHTFNSLHMSGKKIVLSADVPPSQLTGIEPRLISRFEWGLSIETVPLNKESLKTLLLKKAQEMNLALKGQEKQILEQAQDAHSVIQTLQALSLRSHLDQKEAHLLVKDTLSDLDVSKKELTLDDITDACAKFFKIKSKEIKGSSQVKSLATPRQMTMFLIRKHLNTPYKKIGQYFDRDHSTVMASCTLIQDKVAKLDEDTLNAIQRIEWDIKNK
jgi:chromosomal replication initiator protein